MSVMGENIKSLAKVKVYHFYCSPLSVEALVIAENQICLAWLLDECMLAIPIHHVLL